MKKIILLLTFIHSLSCVNAQSGWNYLPGAPTTLMAGRFDDLYFINDSTGVAVNGDGEIYKTEDYGSSWTLELSVPQYYFRSVEFINDSVGFAGTLNSAVFKTTNAGVTWFHIEQTFPQQVPGVCGIGHFGDTVLMVGIWSNPAYTLRSVDGGNTWSYSIMGVFAHALIDCWFKTADTVFVSGQSQGNNNGVILRSVDGGQQWQQVGLSPQPSAYCWKMQFTSSSIGYSSCEELTGSNSSHILKTTDGGASWFSLTVDTTSNIDMEGIGFLNDSVGWVGGWIQSLGMLQTNDGGYHWSFVNFGKNLNRFVFRSPNLAYAAGLSIYKFTGITTGIQPDVVGEKYIHQLSVYPNPASDCIHLKLIINKTTTAILDFYDEHGKLMNNFISDRLDKKEYDFNYDVTKLAKGNYYAVLRTNEHFLTKKFVVE